MGMCGGDDKPEQTAEEAALGKIAIARWNDYQIRFKPVEDQFIHDVQRTESDYDQAAGQANTSVQQAFSGVEEDLSKNMFLNGIDPSSDAFVKTMDGLSMDRGLSLGAAKNEAEVAVDNQDIQGLQTVVSMGQGQATESIQGQGHTAMEATGSAISRANNSFNNRNAGRQLAGTAAGAGLSHYMNTPKSSAVTDKSSQFYMRPDYISNSINGGN